MEVAGRSLSVFATFLVRNNVQALHLHFGPLRYSSLLGVVEPLGPIFFWASHFQVSLELMFQQWKALTAIGVKIRLRTNASDSLPQMVRGATTAPRSSALSIGWQWGLLWAGRGTAGGFRWQGGVVRGSGWTPMALACTRILFPLFNCPLTYTSNIDAVGSRRPLCHQEAYAEVSKKYSDLLLTDLLITTPKKDVAHTPSARLNYC